MKSFIGLVASALISVAPVDAMGNAALDKIIQMLGEMEARGKKEKQTEQVAFASFKTWCDNAQAEKEADIKVSFKGVGWFFGKQ